jgi:hypothetical protein
LTKSNPKDLNCLFTRCEADDDEEISARRLSMWQAIDRPNGQLRKEDSVMNVARKSGQFK